jgi:hypothetical protein
VLQVSLYLFFPSGVLGFKERFIFLHVIFLSIYLFVFLCVFFREATCTPPSGMKSVATYRHLTARLFTISLANGMKLSSAAKIRRQGVYGDQVIVQIKDLLLIRRDLLIFSDSLH